MFASKRSDLRVVLIIATILIVIVIIVWANYQRAPTGEIPAHTLKQFQEKLAEFQRKNRPVVLNFWASWCPPCRAEARDLEKTWQKYKGKVEFIGIDIQNDVIKEALSFLKEFGITYPQVRDHSGQIAISYKITGVPETFLITKEGKIVEHIVGATTEATLSQAIEEKLLK